MKTLFRADTQNVLVYISILWDVAGANMHAVHQRIKQQVVNNAEWTENNAHSKSYMSIL